VIYSIKLSVARNWVGYGVMVVVVVAATAGISAADAEKW
jgi:hypothetical protein